MLSSLRSFVFMNIKTSQRSSYLTKAKRQNNFDNNSRDADSRYTVLPLAVKVDVTRGDFKFHF